MAKARERFGALSPVPETGYGVDLGFAVRAAAGRCPLPRSVGEYFWGVGYGTAFWIDPAEQLIVVEMMLAPDRWLYYRHLLSARRRGHYRPLFQLSRLVEGRADVERRRPAQIARLGSSWGRPRCIV